MRYKTAFRLALRAIGVLIVVENLPWVVSTAAIWLFEITHRPSLASLGSELPLRWMIAHAVGLVLGLYLCSGGRWIVDRVIPSNRPYCPECGYELTGLSGGACPECGTALQR